MIAVVIVSAFLIVVIALALLILLYRAKNGELSLKHKRFLGSPTASDSRNASQVCLQTHVLGKTKELHHKFFDVFDSPHLCHKIINPSFYLCDVICECFLSNILIALFIELTICIYVPSTLLNLNS